MTFEGNTFLMSYLLRKIWRLISLNMHPLSANMLQSQSFIITLYTIDRVH